MSLAKILKPLSPSLFEWLYTTRSLTRGLGVGCAAKIRLLEAVPAAAPKMYSLSLPGVKHVVWLRPGTTDLFVLQQIFLEEQYGCIPPNDQIRLIVDCGANVGFSSVYFLNRFPNARVIAVEPDPENAAVCRRNLEPYGERASVRQTAIWSHPTMLTVEHGVFGDGREWAVSVREARDGDSVVIQAIDMGSLIGGADSVDLLKVDIEGSELQLFGRGVERWLPRVRNLLIELHGEACETAVMKALGSYGYQRLQVSEVTACLNLQPEAAGARAES